MKKLLFLIAIAVSSCAQTTEPINRSSPSVTIKFEVLHQVDTTGRDSVSGDIGCRSDVDSVVSITLNSMPVPIGYDSVMSVAITDPSLFGSVPDTLVVTFRNSVMRQEIQVPQPASLISLRPGSVLQRNAPFNLRLDSMLLGSYVSLSDDHGKQQTYIDSTSDIRLTDLTAYLPSTLYVAVGGFDFGPSTTTRGGLTVQTLIFADLVVDYMLR